MINLDSAYAFRKTINIRQALVLQHSIDDRLLYQRVMCTKSCTCEHGTIAEIHSLTVLTIRPVRDRRSMMFSSKSVLSGL